MPTCQRVLLSIGFLDIEILPGGFTPVGQPLDKVINKVFKGHFCELYNHYTPTAPMDNGSPKAPTRQLLQEAVGQACMTQVASRYLGHVSLGYDSCRVCQEIIDIGRVSI